MRLRRAFLWTMIGSLAAAALLGIAALLLPDYGPDEEILSSVALFAVFSLPALLCAIVLEKRRLRVLMWIGIGASAAALGSWLVVVWGYSSMRGRTTEAAVKISMTLTIAAAAAAHAGLLVLPRLEKRAFDIVRRATMTGGAVLAAFGALLVWWYDPIEELVGEWVLERGGGTIAILVACGTVVTPILWKVQALRHAGEPGALAGGRVRIDLACPRCGLRQVLAAGRRACAGCGLSITIDVQEPRCACGFLLHGLASDRCPECGRAVPEQDRRWAAAGEPPP